MSKMTPKNSIKERFDKAYPANKRKDKQPFALVTLFSPGAVIKRAYESTADYFRSAYQNPTPKNDAALLKDLRGLRDLLAEAYHDIDETITTLRGKRRKK